MSVRKIFPVATRDTAEVLYIGQKITGKEVIRSVTSKHLLLIGCVLMSVSDAVQNVSYRDMLGSDDTKGTVVQFFFLTPQTLTGALQLVVPYLKSIHFPSNWTSTQFSRGHFSRWLGKYLAMCSPGKTIIRLDKMLTLTAHPDSGA